ncbi:MAG TPA: hypothetical protein VGQ09_06300 [Chitinophagaceae bacterium]|jgi:hypothetical protein|nr:hypothetical protein [Chitinophagaceae bacterium]
MIKGLLLIIVLFMVQHTNNAQTIIDRKDLVQRHAISNTKFDPLSSLTVGNGKFAFTVDVTGLQSFPDFYAKGIPLGTESEWGWHSFPNTNHYKFEETLKTYHLNGRDISYSVQWNESGRNKDASNWFRQNPHRLQLGNIGFEIKKKNGLLAGVEDIGNIHQQLNLWTGEIHSQFTIGDTPVDVITYCHQQQDAIAVKMKSELIKNGRLQIRIRFPYPTGEWTDVGNNWNKEDKHFSFFTKNNNGAEIHHVLDSTEYWLDLKWSGKAIIEKKMSHYFVVIPTAENSFEFVCRFSSLKNKQALPTFSQTQSDNIIEWKKFWQSGGAIDFSGSTDPRADELERRIILSQYLLKVQETGNYPPQETGLTYNSWFGKPHLEMMWWHAAHYAFWGRIELLEKTLNWYAKVFSNAKAIAGRQGFEGVRWQKMTDNHGDESPSSVGAFLIWQQPHFIYFAELCYRDHKDVATLNKYKDLVFATADFMASFPFYEKENDRYILGKGLIPAQERYKPEETFNPAYELAYWHWALSTAQQWRARLGMQSDKKWNEVLQKLSLLPVKDAVYLAAESAPDSYTKEEYKTDHPSVLGAYGMLPFSNMIDTAIIHRTFDLIWNKWNWKETWGWDFPMTAMTATRLGNPEKAMDALFMNVQSNTYLINGHNYQDERLRLYLPGNGGLLTAIAMMCAGWDGCTEKEPGIPKNGKWKVRWEGLKQML